MSSHWRKWITEPGRIRIVALEGAEVAHEICVQQGLPPAAWPGLGEAVVGALLIASSHKSNEAINLNAKGSGLFRQAIIDASPEGRVRGFLITNDEASAKDRWGEGVLSILYTKNFEGKHPYTGMVAFTDGRMDTAINSYYHDSEQLASRVALDVRVDDRDRLIARGVLVQTVGGAELDELRKLAGLGHAELARLAELVDQPEAFAAAASELLGGVPVKQVEETPLKTFCTCSIERIERALTLTGKADTLDALGTDPSLEITCDFCRTRYEVSAERVRSLFSRDPSRLQ